MFVETLGRTPCLPKPSKKTCLLCERIFQKHRRSFISKSGHKETRTAKGKLYGATEVDMEATRQVGRMTTCKVLNSCLVFDSD